MSAPNQPATQTQHHRPYDHGNMHSSNYRPNTEHTEASKSNAGGWGSNTPSSEGRDEAGARRDTVQQKREDKAIDKEPDVASGKGFTAPPGDNHKTLGEFEAERKGENK